MTLHRRTVERDVRELGALLGDVIEDQASTDAYEVVERLRTAAIDYRRGDADSRDPLRETVEDLDPATESAVARAFTSYFELVNLAEERERIRAIRSASQEGSLADSLGAAVDELAAADVDAATVESLLDDVLIEPTFTAHPTEARRKTVKSKLRAVTRHLETLDERLLTDTEEAQVKRDIDAEITSLWQTAQVRDRRPEPGDEARNVQWYLENTLFDVTGEVYAEFEEALGERFEDVSIPQLFQFRSWAGSDADGNPYVTPAVTTETLDRQRSVVVERYRDELKRLSGVVSQDGRRIETDETFEDRLAADRERFPSIAGTAAERYPNEPYRQQLRLMRERLVRVGDVRPGGYENADELVADLDALAASLRANGAGTVATAHVDPLRRQVATFEFQLASLDLRDHRENHTTAVVETLDRQGVEYGEMDENERVATLTDAVLQAESVIDVDDRDGVSDTTGTVLERFASLAGWEREYGSDAIDTYCISMTEEPSHVLEVLFLADQAGVVSLPDHSGLDVVPLLETESALSGADRIMGTLFENEAYAAAVAARGGTQEIMLGYSDSNKENGFLAANWELHRNQRRLGEIVADYDVSLRLFHGRGGSISRGGGPMNEALRALPNSTVTGEVKFTEQGEAIAEKYATPRIAERNLEQMLNAQLLARHDAVEQPTEDVPAAWADAMDAMASAAREEYRDLLESEGFVEFFGQATPIGVIENLNLGSRPASRSGERTVEDLRAIPWVFSWTQARCILPGWYALGTGIETYLDEGSTGTAITDRAERVEVLREMYAEWPFFRTTLDNAALSLARTEMEVAESYAGMADEALAGTFFPRIRDEYERAVEHVTAVTDRDSLVRRDWLLEGLDRRNPYVDPLNVLQIHLLRQDERTEAEERALRLTVKGIAAGMKTTG
ncbi:phosphoenolpyruvate carboxylase [Halococcus salsus]|uniref:phosphoenolpyruvate carboxylase n=1 Tax=Halococcus salsus TaxID=2162894 RepID=UPI001356F13D|nr:phosphoenolpyruvate carboxylase [Halococcus salsus]